MNVRVIRCMALCLPLPALAATAVAQAPGEEKFVVIKAGRVMTVSGEEYAPGMVIIADGKIRLVGQNLEYPGGATIIDARRETITPGLIHPRTRFQLPAFARSGVHGDLKAGDEVVDSQIELNEFLKAGFTAVCYYPFGSGVPGVSSVMRTAGPESQRRLRDAAYLRVDMTNPAQDKATLRNALKKAQEEIDKVAKAKEEWEKKQKEKAEAEKKKQEEQQKKEGEAPKPAPPQPKPEDKPPPKPEDKPQPRPRPGDTGAVPPPEPKPGEPAKEGEKKEPEQFVPPPMDPKYMPLIDLLQGRKDVGLFIELDQASDYLHAEDVLKPHEDFPRTYYLGTRLPVRESDYDYVVKVLGEKKARVVMPPALYYLPFSVEQYNLAHDLGRAGASVAFAPWWDAPLEYTRIRDRLADLVRAGMDRKTALKGVTQYAADAVGLGARLGSLEKDKDADITFFTGDPLSPLTRVSRVMIAGEVVYEAGEDRP